MDKATWLEKRRKCITGTDIASILGLNKYGSPMSVFLDKMGLTDPIAENEAMKWGKILEPVIASRYAEDNNVTLTQGVFLTKDEIFGGTPDYIAPDRLLEIKTAGVYTGRLFGETGTDSVPDNYLCQVQWYLNLLDLEKADLAVLIGGQDYRVYQIIRNEKLISILTESATRFWERYILTQDPPPMDSSDSSKEYLRLNFPHSKGNLIAPSNDIIDSAFTLNKVRQEIDILEQRKTALENLIKFAIGENDGLDHPTFRATWKSSKSSTKIDWEQVAKELNPPQSVIEKFTTIKDGSRRFIFSYQS